MTSRFDSGETPGLSVGGGGVWEGGVYDQCYAAKHG